MLEEKTRSGNYVSLQSSDDYAAYFRHLDHVFALLVRWYRRLVEGGNTEAEIVKEFLEKFLATVKVLRLKFQYAQDHQLMLDLNDSGFPHWAGMVELESDLALLPGRQKQLPSRRVVQEMMLEKMLRNGQDAQELLSQMAQIQFAEELNPKKLIFTFTPGNLAVIQNGLEKSGVINCLFSWLCYDKESNRPYIYVMAFDFAGTQEELHEGFTQGDFVSTIRRFGDRVPPLAVLATDIDENLPQVFPKILKRIGLGPIICPRFSVPDDHPQLLGWLSQFGELDDFALLLDADVAFSKGEFHQKKGWLSFAKSKVRQIFAISEEDLSGDRRSSKAQRVIMLPHHVLQQISAQDEFINLFGYFTKVTYNREGGIYAV